VQWSGGAVKIDADVLETAAPGEILLPRTVMDLVVGAGFDFVDRGLRPLPGIAADWRLIALK
jgi:class 3 adenylate cyclase